MTAGLASDLSIKDPWIISGMKEIDAQMTDVFGPMSNNSIIITDESLPGYIATEVIDLKISNAITRRDGTSNAAGTNSKMTQSDIVSVKVDRRFQVENNYDSFKKIGKDDSYFKMQVGRDIEKGKLVDKLNTGLLGLVASFKSNADASTGVVLDKTGNSINHLYLTQVLSKFGDAANKIVCWVMHSKVYYDLLAQSITDKIVNVADLAIAEGKPLTIGRPTVVTDSDSLITSGSPNVYHVLGLTANALMIKQSEPDLFLIETVGGLENFVLRAQGEFSYNVRCGGYAYQSAGGHNPEDAVIGSSTYWSKVATNNKDTAGIMLNIYAAEDSTKTV